MQTLKRLSDIFMKETRLAINIVKILIKDRMLYPGKLIVDTFSVVARCGILLILYWYVFKLNNGVINNTTFLFTAWSMFFYFSFSVLHLSGIARTIMQDVQSGNVEVLFSKPVSYLLYRIWWQIGSGIFSFIIISIVASILLTLAIGFPPTITIGMFLPSFTLTFLLGAVLTLCVYSIVGLLSFWIEDVNPIFWIVDKAVMILGGSYLPIALFPLLMYKIALYSPFGASFFITHTVSPSWQNNWYELIGIQLLWIFGLGIIVYWMYEQARKKVSVNGG